jgi:hypothetical protein
MKTLLAFCVAFLSLGAVRGQTLPVAKANVVLIQTPDSAATALRKLAAVFVAQGYTVERLDTQFFTLVLAPKMLTVRYNPTLTARAHATAGANSTLSISGDYKGFVMGDVPLFGFAQFYGSAGTCNKTCFAQLQQAAVAYPGGRVTYAKQ